MHQVQSEENLIQKQLLAPLFDQQERDQQVLDQQARLAFPTIDVRKYQTGLNRMFLQVISDQISTSQVTQNQEEPDGGTVKQ